MKRSMQLVLGSIMTLLFVATPLSALADTMSVTQVITVTATVAPARSIVVNDKGQIIKIYSNTPDGVTPKVYVGDVPGPQRPLTPELYQQYQQVIAQHKDLGSAEIPVPLPTKQLAVQVKHALGGTMSLLLHQYMF